MSKWQEGAIGQVRAAAAATSAERDPDRFLLGVLLEGLEALIAAPEARLLVAAERRRDVALGVGVHADDPGPQGPCHTERRVQIPRVHGRREAVGRLVG